MIKSKHSTLNKKPYGRQFVGPLLCNWDDFNKTLLACVQTANKGPNRGTSNKIYTKVKYKKCKKKKETEIISHKLINKYLLESPFLPRPKQWQS